MQAANKTGLQAFDMVIKPAPFLFRYLFCFLILTGLLISGYLLNRYINISSQNQAGKIDVCSALFGKGCDSALTSPMSSLFGLPLAGWAVTFYISIILLLLVPVLFGNAFKKTAGFFLSSFCLSGLIAAITLLAVMIISPKVFCPLCAVIHAVNIGLFIWLPNAAGFSRWQFFTGLKEGVNTIFSKKIFLSVTLWKGFGILTILFLMIATYFGLRAVLASTITQKPTPPDFVKILKEYRTQPFITIPSDSTDPSVGIASSEIQVVIFSDFFCSGCKIFSLGLKKIIDNAKGKYNIRFKNFPLDKKCNPILKNDGHTGACEAAFAAEAAARQGKFWSFHDSLFAARNTADEAKLLAVATDIGLDMEWFNAYRRSDSAATAVSRDISLARQLGINATPTIYLNGKLVADMRPVVLQFLINEEIIRMNATADSAGVMNR